MTVSPFGKTFAALFCCFAVGVLCSPAPVDALPGPQWAARLYPQNPDYVEISVDTREVAANASIYEVTCEVTYENAKEEPTKVRYEFSNHHGLESGYVYRQYFRHPLGAQRANGTLMTYSSVATGLEFANEPTADQRAELESKYGKVKAQQMLGLVTKGATRTPLNHDIEADPTKIKVIGNMPKP